MSTPLPVEPAAHKAGAPTVAATVGSVNVEESIAVPPLQAADAEPELMNAPDPAAPLARSNTALTVDRNRPLCFMFFALICFS